MEKHPIRRLDPIPASRIEWEGAYDRTAVKWPLALVVFLLLFGCSGTPPQPVADAPSIPIVATVNGADLTLEDFELFRRAKRRTAPDPRNRGEAAVDSQRVADLWGYIEQTLLLQDAGRHNLEVAADELRQAERALRGAYPERPFYAKLDARGMTVEEWRAELKTTLLVRKLIKRKISSTIRIDRAAVRAYYGTRRDALRTKERLKLQQIVTESKVEAHRLRAQLVRGADFARLARTSSVGPERSAGGVAGWFARDELPRELSLVVFKLKRGQLSPVVQTPFGFHLMRIVEVRPTRRLPFSEVKSEIEKKLFQEHQALAYHRYVQALWRAATVRIYFDVAITSESSAAI